MSTRVIGFKPPDEEYASKVKAYRACVEAGVPVPKELERFFDYGEPDDAGMEVDISNSIRKWDGSNASGFEVEVATIPEGVKVIRFYNSW
jgi:hypothetical protein